MEVSFNSAEGASVDLMRRWLNSLGQSGDSSFVPLHTYGILCKSKNDTLFPLLCCNAGGLPEGMEIRDERGHFARNAAYVSPVLSAAVRVRNGESYHCERVVELPDDVKRSLENVCLFFCAEESVEKPDFTETLGDFREKLELFDEYCSYDKDIKSIRWIGEDLISDLKTLADADAGHATADENREKSLWEIMEKARAFHQKITDRSENLTTDASDTVHSTRESRVEALETLKEVFCKLSAQNIVDMISFQMSLSNLYASYGRNDAISTFHAQATPIIKRLETEREILKVSQRLRVLEVQLERAIKETEGEEADSHDYNTKHLRLKTLEAMKTGLRSLTLRA